MINVRIDPRDNGANMGGVCSKCCCEPIGMRPGETELVTLDYSAWVFPIIANNGGQGLVPTPIFTITEDASTCEDQQIDGFGNPLVSNAEGWNAPQDIPAGVAHVWNPVEEVLPVGNTFTLQVEPVGGPLNGVLDPAPLDGTGWTYTPRAGFNGYETIWVRITDAQRREIVRPIFFRVGSPVFPPPFDWGFAARHGVIIDRAGIQIDCRRQTLSFPMQLQLSNSCDTIDACRRYRITMKATARDCERAFTHITCMDVFCRKC